MLFIVCSLCVCAHIMIHIEKWIALFLTAGMNNFSHSSYACSRMSTNMHSICVCERVQIYRAYRIKIVEWSLWCQLIISLKNNYHLSLIHYRPICAAEWFHHHQQNDRLSFLLWKLWWRKIASRTTLRLARILKGKKLRISGSNAQKRWAFLWKCRWIEFAYYGDILSCSTKKLPLLNYYLNAHNSQ